MSEWGEQNRGSGVFNIGQPQPWTQDALCAQVGGNEWFPEVGDSANAAKKICRVCPVTAECLKFAMDNNERYGVWGAKSERDRHKLRSKMRAGAPIEPEPEMEPLDPVRCGTPAQAKAHYRRGELPCDPCRIAANRDKLERNHKRRAA